MTYVQYINCDKWKKIVGIALWVGATIGLGFGIYELKNNISFENHTTCVPGNDYVTLDGILHYSTLCYADNGFLYYLYWFIAISANIVNGYMIYRTLNNHYKWLEIKCGVKPKTEQVK